jgi:hypothetical protein
MREPKVAVGEVDTSSFASGVDMSVLLPSNVMADQEITVRLVLISLGDGQVTVDHVSCYFSNQNDKFCISLTVLEV